MNPGTEFSELAETILDDFFESDPRRAVQLGFHEYDGRLPDLEPEGIKERIERMLEYLRRLPALGDLPPELEAEREMLASTLEVYLFQLEDQALPFRNPGIYAFMLSTVPYLSRDYAPLPDRFEAVMTHLKNIPAFLDQGEANLEEALPMPFVELGIIASQGIVTSFRRDIPEEAAKVSADLRDRVMGLTETTIQRVEAFQGRLEKEWRPRTNQDFALGLDRYRRMLWAQERIDLPLKELEAMGQANLEENKAAFLETARQIDATKTPQEVMGLAEEDHGTAEALLPETEAMLEELRQFLIDKDIITIPSEVRPIVTETPHHFRAWATAAMNSPGPFESRGDEAYYYVTPVEPDWSEEKAEEWLRYMNRPSLKNVSVHECYPGHYVHMLHRKLLPSKIGRIYTGYAFTEGWAHYTEQMALEEGLGEGDPRLRLLQLQDALLRNCRYLCSIGLHTKGMSLDEATAFIMENAFMEQGPAAREAFRGTFDPGYLNYTLGKLFILQVREKFLAAHPEATLRAFHDKLLAGGAPPIGLLERMVLAE
ncbi:MAG: DUF885 domain-containing protein [Thermoplasmata archaeon]